MSRWHKQPNIGCTHCIRSRSASARSLPENVPGIVEEVTGVKKPLLRASRLSVAVATTTIPQAHGSRGLAVNTRCCSPQRLLCRGVPVHLSARWVAGSGETSQPPLPGPRHTGVTAAQPFGERRSGLRSNTCCSQPRPALPFARPLLETPPHGLAILAPAADALLVLPSCCRRSAACPPASPTHWRARSVWPAPPRRPAPTPRDQATPGMRARSG